MLHILSPKLQKVYRYLNYKSETITSLLLLRQYTSPPPDTSTSSPFHFLVGDHLVVPIGVSHISLRHKKYNQGSERKEQTNDMLRLTQVQEVKLWHSAFLCICRLTLTCILREISTKLEECWLILTGLPSLLLDSLSCRLVTSAVRCRQDTHVTLRQLPSLSSFVQLPQWRSLPTSGRVEISSPNPSSGFAPKQTKESSAWWTTYIVSHFLIQRLQPYACITILYIIVCETRIHGQCFKLGSFLLSIYLSGCSYLSIYLFDCSYLSIWLLISINLSIYLIAHIYLSIYQSKIK